MCPCLCQPWFIYMAKTMVVPSDPIQPWYFLTNIPSLQPPNYIISSTSRPGSIRGELDLIAKNGISVVRRGTVDYEATGLPKPETV